MLKPATHPGNPYTRHNSVRAPRWLGRMWLPARPECALHRCWSTQRRFALKSQMARQQYRPGDPLSLFDPPMVGIQLDRMETETEPAGLRQSEAMNRSCRSRLRCAFHTIAGAPVTVKSNQPRVVSQFEFSAGRRPSKLPRQLSSSGIAKERCICRAPAPVLVDELASGVERG